MSKERLYVGTDADNTSDSDVLHYFGYSKEEYRVTSKRDGPSGGGGDDCCYVIIERKKSSQSPSDGFDEDGWPVDDVEDGYEEDTTGNTTDV